MELKATQLAEWSRGTSARGASEELEATSGVELKATQLAEWSRGTSARGASEELEATGDRPQPAQETQPVVPGEIEVRIDELVCSGLPGIDRRHAGTIGRSFNRELERLLTEAAATGPNGLDQSGELALDEVVGAGPMPVTRSARQLGVELARAVHRTLGGLSDSSIRDPGSAGGRG